jgi:integrase
MAVGDIHHRESRLENTIEKIKTCNRISEENRELLLDFKNFIEAQDLSLDRTCRYLYNWYQLSQEIDFRIEGADKDDLIDLVRRIHQDEIRDEASKYQKMEWKKAIRKMYTDFLESRKKDYDGERLCDFFTLTVDTDPVDPETIPKPRHIAHLIKTADRTRDKAFMAVLWSSMGRISEVLGLQWKDISFKDYEGSEIATVKFRDTKTGGNRKVPLREGYLYLKDLQEKDERSSEPNSFIFRGLNTDKQLSHNGACGIIKRTREKTEIPEKIKTNPHSWRKGKAIWFSRQKNGVSHATLCALGGWSYGSSAVSRYLAIGEEGKQEAVQNIYGLDKNSEETLGDIAPVRCQACQKLNKFEAETCRKCDQTLRTSELFKEVQVSRMKDEIMEEVVTRETEWDEERIEKEAKKAVDNTLKDP